MVAVKFIPEEWEVSEQTNENVIVFLIGNIQAVIFRIDDTSDTIRVVCEESAGKGYYVNLEAICSQDCG